MILTDLSFSVPNTMLFGLFNEIIELGLGNVDDAWFIGDRDGCLFKQRLSFFDEADNFQVSEAVSYPIDRGGLIDQHFDSRRRGSDDQNIEQRRRCPGKKMIGHQLVTSTVLQRSDFRSNQLDRRTFCFRRFLDRRDQLAIDSFGYHHTNLFARDRFGRVGVL